MSEEKKSTEGANSLKGLSDLVHQRSRLSILVTLYEVGEGDFALVKKATGLTDGNLSRHLQTLEEGGLVKIEKGYVGRKPRTVIELTPRGISAFESELDILQNLLADTNSKVAQRAKLKKRAPAAERKVLPTPQNPGVAPAG